MSNMNAFYERLYRQNERVMKFGLDAIRTALARELGPVDYPHILVGGTNGKGQVSALFATAAHRAGLQTGLFTSPHLVEFRERIRVNGRLLPDSEIVEIGQKVLAEYGGDDVPEFCGTALTYFECCLVMALRAFRANHVGFGVFEVGLGGRLDATNALNPSLSVITSISRDHEAYLGHELSQIAGEKAGIMRSGCPVVTGRSMAETLRVYAQQKACSSFDALGGEFDWCLRDGRVVLECRFGQIPLRGAEMLADYQRDNAAVACFALLKAAEMELLPPMRDVVSDVCSHTRWVGRMWPCAESAARFGVSEIVLDGAHNPDGVRAFVDAVRKGNQPRALVVNSCADKAIGDMFPQYLQAFDSASIFVVPVTTTARACSPKVYCQKTGLSEKQCCDSLLEGMARAAECVGNTGTVYISGSLYLIGEALRALDEVKSLESIEI